MTAAALYMALLGPDGLERVAAACHANMNALLDKLTAISGVTRVFNRPIFHEAVIRLDAPVADVLAALRGEHILGGFDLAPYYPELGETLLACTTETRTPEDIEQYEFQLNGILNKHTPASARAAKTRSTN